MQSAHQGTASKRSSPGEAPPKRSAPAFILFANAHRRDMIASHPHLSNAQIQKLLGAKWHTLSAEEQQKFKNVASEAREKYKKDLDAWRCRHQVEHAQLIRREGLQPPAQKSNPGYHSTGAPTAYPKAQYPTQMGHPLRHRMSARVEGNQPLQYPNAQERAWREERSYYKREMAGPAAIPSYSGYAPQAPTHHHNHRGFQPQRQPSPLQPQIGYSHQQAPYVPKSTIVQESWAPHYGRASAAPRAYGSFSTGPAQYPPAPAPTYARSEAEPRSQPYGWHGAQPAQPAAAGLTHACSTASMPLHHAPSFRGNLYAMPYPGQVEQAHSSM